MLNNIFQFQQHFTKTILYQTFPDPISFDITQVTSPLGCIRSPRLFSNNFYLVLKCCILVKMRPLKFFHNWLMF